MIGQHLERRRRVPWPELILLAFGLALAGSGFLFQTGQAVVWAALPLSIGFLLLILGQDGPFAATLTADAIELRDERFPDQAPTATIPYSSIGGVRIGGRSLDPATFRKARSPMVVQHAAGVLSIPAHLNVSSAELYRFLARQVGPTGGRTVHPALAPYLQRQEAEFGPEAIRTYQAASRLPAAQGSRRAVRATFLGLALAGLIWVVVGAMHWGSTQWMPGGAIALTLGLMIYAATFADASFSGRGISNWKKSSLVVSPAGLAMVQGPVQGEVRWAELLDIRFADKIKGFRLSHEATVAGIRLRVPGAVIVIADLYDRPLYVIHEQIHNLAPDQLRPVRPVPR